MINKVIKRDGRVVDFDSSKILAAVEKSMKAAGQAAPQGSGDRGSCQISGGALSRYPT